MVASGIWATQDALKAALRKRTALDRVTVGLGEPSRYEDDHIWIGGEVSDWSQAYVDSAATAKSEDFRVPIYVLVKRSTNDYLVTRDRIQLLCNEVEAALGDYVLDGAAEFAEIVEGKIDELIPDERSRALMVTLTVRIRTWIG